MNSLCAIVVATMIAEAGIAGAGPIPPGSNDCRRGR
jgi:hypothetical protein